DEQPTLTAISTTPGAGERGTRSAMATPAQGTVGVRLIVVPVGYRKAKVNLCEAPNKTIPDVDVPVGVWVGQVAPGSPAQECGLKESDAIVALDGVNTVGISPREFCSRWVGAPGTSVKVTVARRNDRIDCNCRRVSPRELLRDPSDADDTVLVSGMIGVKVRPKVVLGGAWSYTTISINESYEFEVEEVYPGSPAQAAGLKPGDVIYAVDGRRVDRQNFADAISGQPGTDVDLSVRRGKYGIRATCRRIEIGKAPAEVRHDFAARRFF
ncbi:MAG TPA: PDZ domain-containing protein, partial [Candidatus Obscuribacterales bacterium]